MVDLDPSGAPVLVGEQVLLSTPGLLGQAVVSSLLPSRGTVSTPSGRGEEDWASASFRQALQDSGFEEQLTVVVSDHVELVAAGGLRTAAGPGDLVLQVPGPGTGLAQVLLYTAEDGSQTWHLPQDHDPDEAAGQGGTPATRGGRPAVYRIPRMVCAPPSADVDTSRGLVVALGRKVLTVLVFRLVEHGARLVAERVVERWEAEHRPYRLRTYTPGDRSGEGRELADADWRSLAAGRALLLVHGTFSSTRSGFGHLPPEMVEALHQRYQGRVLAFDHPTLAPDPAANARRFAQLLPDGVRLDLDVLAHSRGGLVAREISERPDDAQLAGQVRMHRLVRVGTPNAGTVLAGAAGWRTWIDRVTNLLQWLPDDPVSGTMDAVLTLLKHMALGAGDGVQGLTAMDPAGDYLCERLNRGSDPTGPGTRYFAVASDYRPAPGSPLWRVTRDALTDLAFGRAGNDLVVPTAGVFSVPGCWRFPVPEPLVFSGPDAVEHTRYWGHRQCSQQILDWLDDHRQ